MPMMPRTSKKARKIVDAILGTPSNMQKRSETAQQIDKRLKYQYTSRVR